ncbi:MAG: ParB/RepB/Spo0J family partition protein [Clostridia bacterium]|nr:ParB/RepB/Spo0J family partition protein [Clostridia bacterium]
MAKKTHGLGRGLDSLFQMTEEDETLLVREIDIGELDPNPGQPRKQFNETGLEELADSVREQGILQPLLVVATGNGRYRIVAGERRFRAARKAGLSTVPCIVRDLDEAREMEVALIENLQREDLNPLDEALGIKMLMDQYGYTQEKAAQRIGKNRSTIANSQRLLTLPEEVMNMLRDGRLTAGHARAVLSIRDQGEEAQIEMARRISEEKMNVRKAEDLTSRKKAGSKKPRKEAPRLQAELADIRETIRLKTGLRCEMAGSDEKGTITLSYGTRGELELLLERLNQISE